MSPLAGLLFAAALLVGVAGLAKVVSPDPTRVALRTAGLPSARWMPRALGLSELAITIVVFVVAGRLGAGLVAAAYVGFAAFSALLLRRSRGRASCGCFGGSDSPVTKIHVVLNLLVAGAAAACMVEPVPHLIDAASDTPWGGVPFILLVALLAWLVQVALTALPALQAAEKAAPPRTSLRSTQTGRTLAAPGRPNS